MLTALFVAWVVLVPERAGEMKSTYVQNPKLVFYLAFMIVLINIVSDFFSLWESRFVIGRMAVAPGTIRIAAYLFLDLIATVIIFVAAIALAALADGLWYNKQHIVEHVISYTSVTLNDLTMGGALLFSYGSWGGDIMALVAYTTLFTSVWVWLFMLGGVLWPLFTWLRGVLGVDKFPVGSAMAIGGVFGGLVVTALGYVRMAVLS